jgi:cytoplasmic iron level regulating protein YaaA (DUF328/UPF0246 family)
MTKNNKKRKEFSTTTAGTSTTATRRSTRLRAVKTEPNNDEPKDSSHDEAQQSMPSLPSTSKSSSSSLLPSYKMLMILSPAKTLNLEQDANHLPIEWTEPLAGLQTQRKRVVAAVKKHAASASKLGSLLKTSTSLTATAQGYWKNMSSDGASSASASASKKPSIMTFDGAAYSGLNVRDSIATNLSRLQYLQDHLRIVDPLYGWLRPMDAIEAYRLEMASKGLFAIEKNEHDTKLKLEDYWKPGIASCLKAEETEAAATPTMADANAEASSSYSSTTIVVVNLASDEYSSAVDRAMVKIVFKHGQRTIAVHAKRARGLMVRYAALNAIETVDELKGFDMEGYSYQPDQSTYDGMGGAKDLLYNITTTTTNNNNKRDEEKETTKGKKKKKKEPLTLVFDRLATYKRPK